MAKKTDTKKTKTRSAKPSRTMSRQKGMMKAGGNRRRATWEITPWGEIDEDDEADESERRNPNTNSGKENGPTRTN